MDATVQKSTTDRAKFVGAAETRVNRAMKAIRTIGKLDARGGFSGPDVQRIVLVLADEMSAMESRLMRGANEPMFQFGDDDGAETDYTRG